MPSKLRLAVLASGRGTDLQSLLDAAEAKKLSSRVELVVSDKPEAPALERARAQGVSHAAVPVDRALAKTAAQRRHEEQVEQLLEQHRIDVVVLAGYLRLLTPIFVQRYRNRIVNIHPALLPSFPGLHAQKQALEAGVRIAGCTTHYVDEETDHGPILLQAAVPVQARDTEETLSRRILEVEHQLLPRTIHLIEQGRVRVEGRHALIDPDASWTKKYPVVPGVFYGFGY